MSRNKQTTKKQHIVPKFYLRKFSNQKGFIEILDLQEQKTLKPYPYGGLCYEDFFYSQDTGKKDVLSQEIEEWFKQIENAIAAYYPKIISNIFKTTQITNEDIDIIAGLMAMLWMRSKFMREKIKSQSTEMTKDIMAKIASGEPFEDWAKRIMDKKGVKGTNNTIKNVKNLLIKKDYNLSVDNIPHLNLLTDIEEFHRWFWCKRWRIYIHQDDNEFITSDTPVIEWFPKKKGIYGAHIRERRHYFPLTPKILIELSDPTLPGKKIKRKTINEKEVDEFNLLRAGYSLRYCYSSIQKPLDEILWTVNNRQPEIPGIIDKVTSRF